MTGYYFIDDYRLDNPYPGQQGGANVPGFDALTLGRAQLWSFGGAKTFGQNTVNDFHVSLAHNANNVGVPHGGLGVTLASQGFVTGPGTPGIVVLAPQFEGVENLVFNTFTMGVTITGVNQTGDTLHVSDSVSKVLGAHTLKVGGQYQFPQVRLEPNATFNGTFTFAGTETGSDFADFLLGVPSNYIQSSGGDLLSAESVRRRVRAGQLARAIESDDQLRPALGHDGAVVREGQPDPDHRAGPAVGGVSRRADRAGVPRRCRHRARVVAGAFRQRLAARSASRTRRTRRPACARATGCSTRRFKDCRRASCTASRPTATTISARRRRCSRRRSSRRPTAPTTASGFRSSFRRSTRRRESGHEHRLVAVPAGERRSVLRLDEQDAVFGELHVLGPARARSEHGGDGELRRHPRPQHARHSAGESRRSGAVSQRQPARDRSRPAARRAGRSARTASTPRPPGRSSTARARCSVPTTDP